MKKELEENHEILNSDTMVVVEDNVKEDFSNLKVFTVDGYFIRCDTEEGRILFYYDKLNARKGDVYVPKRVFVAEIRMSASKLKELVCALDMAIKNKRQNPMDSSVGAESTDKMFV